MKIFELLNMAIERVWNRKLVFIINICLGIVSFLLIEEVLHIYNSSMYTVNKSIDTLDVSQDELYLVQIKDYNFEDLTLGNRICAFISSIDKVDAIEYGGCFNKGAITIDTYIKGLGQIYYNYEPKVNSPFYEMFPDKLPNDNIMNALYLTDASILQICGVSLKEGNVKEFGVDGDVLNVFIGSELAKVLSIGDEYVGTMSDQRYKVVGILEEDSYYLFDGLFSRVDGNVCLDGYIVVPEIMYVEGDVWTTLKYTDSYLFKTTDIESARKDIEELAKENRLVIEIKSYEELVDEYISDDSTFESCVLLTVVVLFLTFVSYVTTRVVEIFTAKNEIGILYSCGFSSRNISIMLLYENAINLVLSVIIALMISYSNRISKSVFGSAYVKIDKEIFFSQDIWMVGLIALVMLILSTVIPYCVLKRLNINQMIEE